MTDYLVLAVFEDKVIKLPWFHFVIRQSWYVYSVYCSIAIFMPVTFFPVVGGSLQWSHHCSYILLYIRKHCLPSGGYWGV